MSLRLRIIRFFAKKNGVPGLRRDLEIVRLIYHVKF